MTMAEGTALAAVNSLTGPVEMTLDEAAAFLHPPITRQQLGRIAAQLPKFGPVGKRSSGGGRPIDTYDAGEIIELHHAVRRWL